MTHKMNKMKNKKHKQYIYDEITTGLQGIHFVLFRRQITYFVFLQLYPKFYGQSEPSWSAGPYCLRICTIFIRTIILIFRINASLQFLKINNATTKYNYLNSKKAGNIRNYCKSKITYEKRNYTKRIISFLVDNLVNWKFTKSKEMRRNNSSFQLRCR